MAQDTSALRGTRSGVLRPAASASSKTRSAGTVRTRTSPFGLLMLAPSLIVLAFFFFAPVALTAIFSFTNMTSATGISGGAYVLTPNLVTELQGSVPAPVLDELAAETVVVDQAGLALAREEGVDDAFLADIEDHYLGQSFDDERAFQRELKTLPSRPRSIRQLKLASEPFSRSILNQRFESRSAAEAAISAQVADIEQTDIETILKSSYTGWVWTTQNYQKLTSQRETARILGNTALYVVITLSIFNVSLGLFIALATFYLPRNTGSVFNVLWFLPRITPVVLYTIMWKWFTWDDGFLPVLASYVGLPSFNYMKGSVFTAWATIISLNGFIGASFGMILFTGALKAIPVQQLWASEVDGASRLQQIRRIILPHLRWPILFVSCYQGLSLLSSYEQIWLTTNGGPGSTTMVWALQAFRVALSNYTGNLQYGYGAAMAMVLVVVGLILSIVFLRLFRFGELVEKPKIDF